MDITNTPYYRPKTSQKISNLNEIWYLKLVDTTGKTALWLRFTLLCSKGNMNKQAEVWAILFEKNKKNNTKKYAFKQTFPINKFRFNKKSQKITIDLSELTNKNTLGKIIKPNRKIKWNFKFKTRHKFRFDFVPSVLSKLKLVKNKVWTTHEDILFTGTCTVNSKKYTFRKAPGMIGHYFGPKSGHSWLWAHCNSFVDKKGAPINVIFDGIRARSRLGKSLASPYLTTMFFYYKGQAFYLNTLTDVLRHKSKHKNTEWTFTAKKGKYKFCGKLYAKRNAFAGLTYTDTDGSKLYCYNSKLANMTLHIYHKGILENTLYARGTAAFENVTRKKNPHIPLLI